ncbi:MAG: hypothetical protein WA949_15360 [Phormidesmis sp.]
MSMRALLFLLSLIVYGLAQALPCLSFIAIPTELALEEINAGNMSLDTFDKTPITMNGLKLTTYGALALLLFWQIAAVGWLANPIYWCAAVLFSRRQYRSAAIAAVLSVIVGGIGTYLAFYYPLPAGSTPYSSLALQQMRPGFWLWLTAPVMLALSSIFCLVRPTG